MYNITFETKCWENDWEYVLKTAYLDKMIERCQVDFQTRQLIINNVNDREQVRQYAQDKVDRKIIDVFYFVEDYIEEALTYYDIRKESFGRGYWYSSAELVGLYLSKTKYHLHFSSDSFMARTSKNQWIAEAYHLMEKHPEYVVANPAWNLSWRNAKKESNGEEIGRFWAGYGFSDQCYLVRTNDFRTPIYNYAHPASDRYPEHGGESFEKRVDSWMRSHSLKRLTSMKESYISHHFPVLKSRKLTRLLINLNLYDFYCKLSIRIKHPDSFMR
ncbi:MAG: hypothetical protein LBH19_06750 [Dysgonamonadaceae bacterium]|jgi:hypothetical protein|nr:hypothetical protein [Dysgonamonadaceae bacterium]